MFMVITPVDSISSTLLENVLLIKVQVTNYKLTNTACIIKGKMGRVD